MSFLRDKQYLSIQFVSRDRSILWRFLYMNKGHKAADHASLRPDFALLVFVLVETMSEYFAFVMMLPLLLG